MGMPSTSKLDTYQLYPSAWEYQSATLCNKCHTDRQNSAATVR